MFNKYWKIVAVCSVLLIVLTAYSLWYIKQKAGLNLRGQYIFAQTKENISALQKIKLTTPDTGEINIYLKNDGVWHFAEAADYFVNPEQLSAFYYMVNNAVITAIDKNSDFAKTALLEPSAASRQEEGTLVETYDFNGNLLDKIIIGKPLADAEYRFARNPEYPYTYTISSVQGFSGRADAWIPFPLLQIPLDAVESIKLADDTLSAQAIQTYFSRSTQLRQLVSNITYLAYNGIAYKKDFEEDFSDVTPHKIIVETSLGLIYVLNIYKPEPDEYWLTIKLEHTKIPQKDVIKFVQENQKYFENWIFNLDAAQGKMLYNSSAAPIIESFKQQIF